MKSCSSVEAKVKRVASVLHTSADLAEQRIGFCQPLNSFSDCLIWWWFAEDQKEKLEMDQPNMQQTLPSNGPPSAKHVQRRSSWQSPTIKVIAVRQLCVPGKCPL